MAPPAYQRNWTQALTSGVPGVRIPYVSLADTMGNYVNGIKTFLLANPHFAVVWSSSNGVGPADANDHTDRIVNAAAWTPRSGIAAASQAWLVLSDGNGGQLLIAYTAAADDAAYIGYSPGATYALQATTTFRPLATDEINLANSTDLVGGGALDRVWHGLVSDDGKAFRFTVLSGNTVVGASWCVEDFVLPATVPANVQIAGVYGGFWASNSVAGANNFFGWSGNSAGIQARVQVNAQKLVAQGSMSTWYYQGQPAPVWFTAKPGLQGGTDYVPWPAVMLCIGNIYGFLGTPKDIWVCAPAGWTVGDGFGVNYEWWQCGVWLWPNPSGVAPTVA